MDRKEKEKYIEYLENLKDSYDAFYFLNKYSEIEETTHSKEFIELIKLLESDDISMKALSWIKNCYDCYYKNKIKDNEDNAFSYLKNKINELYTE